MNDPNEALGKSANLSLSDVIAKTVNIVQRRAGKIVGWEKRRLLFAANASLSKSEIIKFADGLNIAPGIVVGRLQQEKKLPYTHCNDLKCGLKWKDAA